MNIIFSSDDNYARHLGVAIYSLLVHNQKVEQIHFYIVDNHISEENLHKLQQVADSFSNASLHFIAFDNWEKDLHLDMPWPISISAYARLFAAEMLSKDIDRVLYLDCDMIINGDLSELWKTDLGDYCIGAVQDQVPVRVKKDVGLAPHQHYFNSGMLLVDMEKWRTQGIGQKCIDFIEAHQGRVTHHDQGVLNGIIQGHWRTLPLKYNVMTIHYLMSRNSIMRYFMDESSFYFDEEISQSRFMPVIVHYTPSFTTRPWFMKCDHPLTSLYQIMLAATPWKGTPLEEDKSPWYVKLINWRYRNLPF